MKMTRSDVQEALLQLYLRLNGYFTTGFIVQAPEWGRNRAQVDALAIRHPLNREPERVVNVSPFLELTDHVTDVLICEVKSKGQPLQFNSGLRTTDAMSTVLRWVGLVPEGRLQAHVHAVLELMQPGCSVRKAASGATVEGAIRTRPLLCSPERTKAHVNQPWFLNGSEIFTYITNCFNPLDRRPNCATRYDFSGWGAWLEPVVRYFKDLPPGTMGTVAELYADLSRAGVMRHE
jgi:hypothetical protein